MKALLLTFLLFFTSACHEPNVPSYQNPNEIQLSSIRWGVNDLQALSKAMVQNILSSDKIGIEKDSIYFFEKIRNDTHDQIDIKSLQNKMIMALVSSKRFHFTDEESTMNYLFKGKLSSLFTKTKKSKDMFFTFNMTLINPKTADIFWSHDVEVRKIYNRSLLGW
jgi:PBP1b-binding outer membrane lipoprotein LpoB